MIRKYFSGRGSKDKEKVRWRSHDITRIEALSDAVFGFAISLLIISLEVPKSSEELLGSMVGLIPFVICFMIMFWIWRSQYKFFRRYGLHDRLTLTLNGMLLFVVLGFVYPLKFLIGLSVIGRGYEIRAVDYAPLVMLYNGGFALVGILYFAMYRNALAQSEEIALTEIEKFETKGYAWGFLIPGLASLTAVAIAYVMRGNPNNVNLCYIVYGLLGPVMGIYHSRKRKAFKRRFGDVPMIEPHHGADV